MNDTLDQLPGGFLTMSKEYNILTINQPLLTMLGYTSNHQLIGQSIRTILSKSTITFFQFILYPIIAQKHRADEIHIELKSNSGNLIPALIYASDKKDGEISCVIVPSSKRVEYEKQLIQANKVAEQRLEEKNYINEQLKIALKNLEEKQEELVKVNQQNHKYRVDTQRELELAKKIQETSLTDDIANEQLQIESYYNASHELSGDIYGFYQINKSQYGVILLDVMGHGISSALITMSLEALFQRLISKGMPTDLVLKELDDHLHALFYNNEDAWHYCTAIYLFIDTERQTIEYINAGHPPALYQDSHGQQKELNTSTPPIGTFKGIDFRSTSFSYQKGSKLLLYTDGISEPLGQDKLASLLKENTTTPLTQVKQNILHSLENESNHYYKNDDQCFILIDLK
ncbi:SpoIIE family protein phosphatase [Aquibacillus kalidii]|uniref:SpoIIE family protein phosphatase n=1 Tax=Aquibacillus kalidii TaxID=2762597 RepID=UPI001647F148|nr:SpoIIE family protein phosphatase [Aquibacillus kalidii]